VTIEYNGAKINASEVIHKADDLAYLAMLVAPYFTNDTKFSYQLPGISHIKCKLFNQTPSNLYFIVAAPNWEKWTSKDDVLLLIGIHKHGIGNWDKIQQDKDLGLSRKISTNPNDILPKVKELCTFLI
jgi:hypothetical protein